MSVWQSLDKEWNFEEVMFFNNVAASPVFDNLKKTWLLCGEEEEVALTSVLQIMELSGGVFETKCKTARLVSRVNDLETELEAQRSVHRRSSVNLEVG